MKRASWAVCGLLALGFLGCERSKTPKTDQEKYSYSIGYQFAKNLKQQNVEVDMDSLKTAITDATKGKDSQVKEEEMQRVMQKMYEERSAKMNAEAGDNLKKSQAWLEANKAKEGVKVTPSGLQYKIIEEGSGAKPKDSDTVVVHYKGTLTDGTEFDSSYKRNQPAEFPLKAVIPGWTEGLQLLKKGGKAQLYIPPELAYGERGRPSIPANSALIFDVELIDIKAGGAGGPGGPGGPGNAKPKGK
jgi:FKBP-type peptidyl-prolyl cis-trans isomerase